MTQTRADVAQTLAERWCGQAARREDARVARRLYRRQVVDGVSRLDEGVLLDDFFSCRPPLGVVDGLREVRSTTAQRDMVPVVRYVLLYRRKTLFGVGSMNALPPLLCSDEALMRLVGCNAQPVRQGVGQRGAATRPGPRTPGPICPDTSAAHLVHLNVRALEVLCNRVIRARAQAGVLTAPVTGIVDATDLETTAPYAGCGQLPRQRKITDKRGHVHASEGTVYGWKLSVLIAVRTKLPLAATVVPIQAHATRSLRALVPQARTNLAGPARLHNVVFAQGCLEGAERWWLAQRDLLCGVPAKDHLAVTSDAQAQAAAGEGVSLGRRAHTVRQGQGKTAWTARLEMAVVGLTGLTNYDP
jgi:hypothetical protein